MTWTEARSGASTATRRVAHDDRAKDRRDETSPSSGPRVRPRWLVPVVVGAALVLLGGAGALAVVASRDDPPSERQAGPSGSGESPGDPQSPAAPSAGEPLSGDLMATGTVTSTSSLGSRWSFPMSVRLDCSGSCRVTVTDVPGQYAPPARAYIERTWSPAGDGSYVITLDEPLSKSGGEVSPGCEALRVKGRGTLVRTGDQVTITTQHGRDQFPGPDGNQCALADRTFVFTGSLS